MSFAWPLIFWFLIAPAALLAWELTRHRRLESNVHPKMLRAEAEFNHLALVARHSATRRARLWFCAGLTLGIVALARPQWGRIDEQVFDQSREILIAVDLSRSMQAQDVKPSRLDRTKLLIQSLLERLEGERVGLIVFSGTAFLQSPLSADYEILREFLPALGPDYLPEGGTNYRAMIDTALQAFGSTSTADRFLIVLSDGEATEDDWKDRVPELAKRGIRVIGLGIGTTSGAMIPDGAGGFVKDERGAVVLSKLENGTLQQLARDTSGTYRDASGWIDLAALVQETVETGRKGDFVEKNQARLVERFQWALAPALLCLLLSFWREFPVLPKPRSVELSTGRSRNDGAGPGDSTNAASTAPASSGAKSVPPILTSLLVLGLLTATLFSSAPLARAVSLAPAKSPAAKSEAPRASAPTAPAAPATEALVAPLSNLAKELALKPSLTAGDWKRFADVTLEYAERRTRAQEPVAPKAITDGIDAVTNGQSMDPKAADWDSLRKKLQEYLKDPEKQQKPPEQQPPPDKKDSDKKDEDQKQKQEQQKQDQQKQDQQKKDSQQKQDDQKSDSSKNDPDKPEDKPGDKKADDKSAFGDMKQPPPPPPSNETQKVGGAQEKKQGEPKDQDPALALPLQKLDQLKNQDSPAKLYQLMDGERKSDPKKKGKDW